MIIRRCKICKRYSTIQELDERVCWLPENQEKLLKNEMLPEKVKEEVCKEMGYEQDAKEFVWIIHSICPECQWGVTQKDHVDRIIKELQGIADAIRRICVK